MPHSMVKTNTDIKSQVREECKYNDNSEFSPSTDLFSSESELSFPTDFYYTVKDSSVQELGFQLAFLYSMIISLSTKEGYCYMQDKTFAQRMNMSVRTIERWLNQLDKKGYIYRNTFQCRQGKKRHIVPSPNYIDYWKKFLNRECVPDSVKKDYLTKIFETQPPQKMAAPIDKVVNMNRQQKKPKKVSTAKNGGSYATAKNGGSLLLRNSNNKREQQTEDDVVVSFEDLIKKELKGIGITAERSKMAIIYYQKNKKLVDSKNNPMGWIIQGIRQGWIPDIVTKSKHIKEKAHIKKAVPPPPPPPRVLSKRQAKEVEKVVKKYKELVDQKEISMELKRDGFFWIASNQKNFKSFTPYNEPGILKLLKMLANNMNQEEGYKYINKLLEDKFYADL